MSAGKLFVLSGPSGVGKNAIERKLRTQIDNLQKITTYTTREKRPTEENGVQYFFVSDEAFENMISNNQFLEWAQVHTKKYGTPKKAVEQALQAGKNVLLIIDVQGALNVKKILPKSELIFIKPEHFEFLERHIVKRSHEMPEEEKQLRLETARRELALADQYDHIVVNPENRLNEAVLAIKKIILSQV